MRLCAVDTFMYRVHVLGMLSDDVRVCASV